MLPIVTQHAPQRNASTMFDDGTLLRILLLAIGCCWIPLLLLRSPVFNLNAFPKSLIRFVDEKDNAVSASATGHTTRCRFSWRTMSHVVYYPRIQAVSSYSLSLGIFSAPPPKDYRVGLSVVSSTKPSYRVSGNSVLFIFKPSMVQF